MKSSPFQFLLALALLVLAVVGYGMWYARVSSASARVANLETQIDAETEAALRVSSTRAALAEIASNETIVNSYFVAESGIVDFIDQLEALGKKFGSSVNVISVASSKGGARPSFAIELTVSGSFDAIMRTVGAIEFSPFDLSVSAFSIRQDAAGAWGADLSFLVGASSTASGAVAAPASSVATTSPASAPQPL